MVYFVRTAGEADVERIRALLAATFHDTYDPFYGAEKVRKMVDGWHSADTQAALQAVMVRLGKA